MQAPLVEPATEPSSVLEPTSQQQIWWRKRRWLVLIGAIVLCTLATTLWLTRHKRAPASHSLLSSSSTETNGVLRLKGTTQAVRTRAIQAPLLAGEKEGTLTITDLRLAGSSVKQGDILVEFDRQAQLRDSLDKQAQNSKLADDVLQEQAKEDAARAKDETEIRVAEGDLAKAELEMQKAELLSRIDAEKAHETLDEAKATLTQLKETFSLKRKTAQASIRIHFQIDIDGQVLMGSEIIDDFSALLAKDHVCVESARAGGLKGANPGDRFAAERVQIRIILNRKRNISALFGKHNAAP